MNVIKQKTINLPYGFFSFLIFIFNVFPVKIFFTSFYKDHYRKTFKERRGMNSNTSRDPNKPHIRQGAVQKALFEPPDHLTVPTPAEYKKFTQSLRAKLKAPSRIIL